MTHTRDFGSSYGHTTALHKMLDYLLLDDKIAVYKETLTRVTNKCIFWSPGSVVVLRMAVVVVGSGVVVLPFRLAAVTLSSITAKNGETVIDSDISGSRVS